MPPIPADARVTFGLKCIARIQRYDGRMPAPFFHPILAQARLGLGNQLRAQLARPAEAVFVALAWLAAAALAAFVYTRLPGEPIAASIESAARSPWTSGLALAAFAFYLLRAPLLALRRHLAHSCWAGMPIAAVRTTRSLVLLGVLQLAGMLLAADVALLACAALVHNPERWLAPARGLAVTGLGIGGLLGLLSAVSRRAALETAARRSGHGSPLFRLLPLERATLPIFAAWQRIETLRRFRAGGRWWQWLLLGLAVPAGITLPSLAGLVLMGVVLIWFGIAMTAARETIAQAARLTAATPLRFGAFAAATARYPLLVAAVSVLWGELALLLQEAPRLFLIGWPVLLFGWTTLELAVSWHVRREPRHAGLRLAVDVAAIVGAAQAFPPLAGIVWAVLLAWHLNAAGKIR
jgi:hypothetical protein